MKPFFSIFLFALALTSAAAIAAQTLDEINTAYAAKDYVAALNGYAKLAAEGNAVAQNRLGEMVANGVGTSKDERQAATWYRKAAEQGDASAQQNLALMYGKGQGVTQDWQQALAWHRKAAEQGHAAAQYYIGVMYAFGHTAEKIRAMGYEIVGINQTSTAKQWEIHAKRKMVPELQVMQATTRALQSLAEAGDGYYDGWGTVGVK